MAKADTPTPPAGHRIGERIAALMVKHHVDAAHRLKPTFVDRFMATQHEFFKLTGSELSGTVGPFWQQMADCEDCPDWARKTFDFMANSTGQAKTILVGAATGAAFGSGVLDVLTNELTPVFGRIIAANPNHRLSPQEAAGAWVRGVISEDQALGDGSFGGYSNDRMRWLADSIVGQLDEAAVVDLLRRGVLSYDNAVAHLKRAGMAEHPAQLTLERAKSLIPLGDLAAMWNRDIITTTQGHELAALTGYNGADFDRYAALGGEPPDYTALILAWRRGVITEAQVDRALVQGPLRKEWIDTAKALRFVPITVEEAANAVNQGHMDLATARRKAEENGLTATDFDVVINNAGIPPGPQEALSWLRRGIITKNDFRSIFLESRLKNKYIDLFLATTDVLMPMETIRLAYRHGAMTAQRAAQLIAQHGYTAEDTASILALAASQRTQNDRDLTIAQVVALYVEHILTRDQAAQHLVALGYDDQEAEFRLELADLSRRHTYVQAVVNRVHTGYVAGRLDVNEAIGLLDEVELPAPARDEYIRLWDVERQALTKPLTLAQLTAALKRGIIDANEYLADLATAGYSQRDANILLALATPAPAQ